MLNKNSLAVKKCKKKGGQVTKPIIVVKMSYKLLHIIQVNGFLVMFNFLALLDIKIFGCLYVTLLLLIGLALFYSKCLAYHCFFVNS